MRSLLLVPLCVAVVAAGPPSGQVAIPWVSRDGIQDFRPLSNRALLIEAIDGKWYRADLMNDCVGLDQALTIGFETSALDQLDDHGSILVEGRRCPVVSVVRAPKPPPRHRR